MRKNNIQYLKQKKNLLHIFDKIYSDNTVLELKKK